MKIILVTEYFYPVSKGGTEQYVYFLAKGLQAKNHEVVVIAVHESLSKNEYENIEIQYITPHLGVENAVIKGYEPADNLPYFEQLIKNLNPDVIHFHTFTTSINHHHIAVAKQHHFKTVFTSHIPDHLCLTGGLRQNGNTTCNGKISVLKCSYCATLAKPENIILKSLRFARYVAPVKDTPVKNKWRDLKMLNELSDQLMVVSNWQKTYWERNISPKLPILICRQGVNSTTVKEKTAPAIDKIRIGFVGRISAIKGLHLIFEALQQLDDLTFELHIAGIPSEKETDYYEVLKGTRLSSKVEWNLGLNAKEIEVFYEKLDYLVIPSLWLETGPFVAYEALAQGVPLIGSRLGGLKELIKEGENGLLFEPNARDLALALKKIKTDTCHFKISPNEVRKANLIGIEMESIYKQLLGS